MNNINSYYLSILRDSQLMNGFSEEQCRFVCNEIDPGVAIYDKEENIVREGEMQKKFYLCVSGTVRCEKFHREGSVHLVDVYDDGDFIGVDTANSTTRVAPFTLIASVHTELIVIDVDKVLECVYSSVLMNNMMRMLANENIKKTYKIDMISKPGTRERVIAFLEVKANKSGSKTFSIHMTQEQLAQFLCLNRSSLSHELSLMRREGLIDFSRDRFTILF